MFDQLEARANRAVMGKLSNATAVVPGIASPVPVIFDAEYQEGMVGNGMGSAAPQLIIGSDIGTTALIGTIIQVNGASWTVAECQPDSDLPTGLSRLLLEKA